MKTALLFFSFAVIFSFGSSAQITINQGSYTSATFLTTDTVGVVNGTSGMPTNLGGAINATWDFSTVIYNNSDSILYMAAPTGYDFQIFKIDTISSPFLYFNSRGYYKIASSGYMQSVLRIDRRAYSLMGIVLGATAADSIVFLNQLDTLSSPLTLLKFPATMGTNWTSNYTTNIKYTVTYTPLAMTNAPGNYYRYESESDSVIGWGKVTIKRADGSKSAPIDVLQVRAHHSRVDSFYINGSPAPPSLFQPPYFNQGASFDTYVLRFYRAGQVTPLVEITFTDNTYTTPARTKVDWYPSALSVKNVSRNHALIYPNPVTNRSIYIELPEQFNTKLNYRLVNIAGQTVLNGSLPANQRDFEIVVSKTLAEGNYFLRLESNGTQVAMEQVLIK